MGQPDADYLDLVSACFGQGKTSRLYKRLIYDDQIASDVQVFNDSREMGGQFYIQVTARSGHSAAELEKAIDEELARFLKEGPTPSELERVQEENAALLEDNTTSAEQEAAARAVSDADRELIGQLLTGRYTA